MVRWGTGSIARMVSVALVSLLVGALVGASSGVAGTQDFTFSGRLTESTGKPIEGPVALAVKFYHVASGGTPVLSVTSGLEEVALQDGVFNIKLTLDVADYQTAFPSASQATYVEVTDLTHAPTAPYSRTRISVLPYASKVPVDSGIFAYDATTGRLTLAEAPQSGKYLKGNADGSVSWEIPASASSAETYSNKTIDAASNNITNIADANIKATAAISDAKLATISTAGKVSGGAITSGTIGGSTAIATSGNVTTTGAMGVGTDSPGSKLEVKGAGATSATSALNATNSSGTSMLYVRNDGRVGVGTTSPDSSLHVQSAASGKGLIIRNNATSPGNLTEWQGSDGTALTAISSKGGIEQVNVATATNLNSITNYANVTSVLDITHGGSTGSALNITDNAYNTGAISISKTTGAAPSNSAVSGVNISAAYAHSDAGFATHVGKGINAVVSNNTATSGTLYGAYVSATANQTTAVGLAVSAASSSGTAYAATFTGGKVGIGNTTPGHTLDVTGNINTSGCLKANGVADTGNCASDIRLKKNIVPITGALRRLSLLRPVHFDWRADEFPQLELGSAREVGLLAQELKEVFPELVAQADDGFYRVRYGLELHMQTIAALRELKEEKDAEIARLREEVELLRAYLCEQNSEAVICKSR